MAKRRSSAAAAGIAVDGPIRPTEHDLKILWGRSAARCAFTGCRQELATDTEETLRNQTAHIISEKPQGPRQDPTYPKKLLHRYENLVVMCSTHHIEIDGSGAGRFTPTDIRKMKADHETWVTDRLVNGPQWASDIAQVEYINVPRLAILAALQGIDIPLDVSGGTPLHDLGIDLVGVMSWVQKLLTRLELRAEALAEGPPPTAGDLLAVDGTFRTRNMPRPSALERYKLSGKLNSDPHVYRKFKGFRLVLPLDPRWVTTNTAFHIFSNGQARIGGLAQVKFQSGDDVIATPIVLGIPRNPIMEAIFGRE